MELRFAQPSDAPKWIELLKKCLGGDYPYKQVYDPVYVYSILDHAQGDYTLVVANGEEIRSSVTILAGDEFIDNPVINLARLLFSPESYEDGSAKALIDQVCEVAKNEKKSIVTRVPVYDIAQQKLLEGCGFVCVGYQPNKHLISTHKGFLFYALKNSELLLHRMTVSGSLSQVASLAFAVFENYGISNPILIRDNVAGYPLESDYEIAESVIEEFQFWKMNLLGKNRLPELSAGAHRGIGFLRLPSQSPLHAILAKTNSGAETRVYAGISYFYDELDKCVRITDGFSDDDITLGAVLQKVVGAAREKFSAAYVEVDAIALSPMLLKCAEQIGFTPCAYFPGLFKVGDYNTDVVKLVKMNVNYEPETHPLTEQASKIVGIISENFRDQKTGMAVINLLRTLPTLHGLGDGELRKIAKIFTQKLYRPGDVIFNKGDQGDEAFVVMRGQVDICLSPESRPIASIGVGQVFGEQAFLEGSPRTAMAVASQPTILLVVNRIEFSNLIKREPHLGMTIMKNIALDLSNKLRRANQAIMSAKM